MDHDEWEIGWCAGGAGFEVELDGSRARVCLMDHDNYQAYLDGNDYDPHGGFWESSPMVLQVPYDSYWHLVIDSNPGWLNYEVKGPFD
ncbi:Uncharacterised protein [Amycolatopsis camponoti]|uniref:DUF1883 domain-containing protein n=1 Tax=Amycolatopsis camponoti TaxID=2606593 RepID=A0A6I8LWK0_9PSEU|nr:DUF1883 domain-containing protein [Amycolatopsis camponoti]VVJ21491.1 Uncharacterised protein [Amycolatopsis camponoti]